MYGECVLKFALLMSEVLADNSHKDGWQNLSAGHILRRIKQETRELTRALQNKKSSKDDIKRECADIANFCMMMCDNMDGDDDYLKKI